MTKNRWADSEAEVIQALEASMTAFSAGIIQTLFDTMHLPYVRIPGDGVAIYATHVTL